MLELHIVPPHDSCEPFPVSSKSSADRRFPTIKIAVTCKVR